MIKFEGSIMINSPLHEVFEFLADPRNTPKWQSGVLQSTITSTGPIGQGTLFDQVVKNLGWKVRATCEITQYEPDKKMSFRAISGPLTYEDQFSLDDTGNGILLTGISAGRLRGPGRLAEPLFGLVIKKVCAGELHKIKQIVELGTSPGES